MKAGYTLIRVRKLTAGKLKDIAPKGETYDQTIWKMFKYTPTDILTKLRHCKVDKVRERAR